MNKIGVLYSGISFQHQTLNDPQYRGQFIPINIYDLPEIDLSLYDAIIVPRSVDQVALRDYKRVIEEFLDLPGILIVLGDYNGGWLPGCQPGGFTREDDEPLIKVEEHPILKDIESEDLHWHKGINGLCSHGHLVPPAGAKTLIRNQRGDTILYEDRSSTKGIIIAGSQFDIFCHCFSRDEGAARALRNIITWVGEEAPLIREKRKQHPIGVIYSGLHFHYNLFTRPEYEDMELLYIRRLPRLDLNRYRLIIIPRESNQEMLYAQREKLIRYLEAGGTILSFGEVILPWMPGLIWNKDLPQVCYPKDADKAYKPGEVYTDNLLIEKPEHSLFEGLSMEDLKWHYHGVFAPQPGQEILLSNGQGKAVILLDEASFKGRLLATTLDPEEHAGFGEVKITERFLARCMAWAREIIAEGSPV
ncbi:hypothetical protein [Sediminispirochaeta smaragdinae]|uniref:Glutamine amidotransferase domain-containing protein n=1 Tax=Sediminispirochaeta smaragdinae (strain DSM 11293 / JCM 15392 / SEBR 4228) TaxID=573413 RepID=E1R8R1_SEDSS|nr:hypothetical protein [Sediminispirochaeta smaragdinae]ADK81818.1 conserved hypothetical protein [Sediminispirochaeta smaragdinae DSM 11293]